MPVKVNTPFKDTPLFPESEHEVFAALLRIPVSALAKRIVGVVDINDEFDFSLLAFHYHPELEKKLSDPKFNYTQEECVAIKAIRGVIVDPRAKVIVCQSFPFTSVYVRNSIPLDGTFDFYEGSGECRGEVVSKTNVFKEWIYGSLIRVFSYEGIVFLSTHRKITCMTSKFEGSRTFHNIFFEEQDVFKTPLEIFEEPRNGLVHLFIIQDRALIVDSAKIFESDAVYYINSLNLNDRTQDEASRMRDRIEELNLSAERPILFPRELTPEEVNAELRGFERGDAEDPILPISHGQSLSDISATLKSLGRDTAMEMFRPGERVVMENSFGIFTVMPPSAMFRSLMMDGKAQISKVFADCVADVANAKTTETRILVPFGFSYAQCHLIREILEEGHTPEFENFQHMRVSTLEVILTNLLFSSPRHRLNECFEAYNNFGDDVVDAGRFLWENRETLRRLIHEKRLDEFPGLKGWAQNLKRYLTTRFCACFAIKGSPGSNVDGIIGTGPQNWWHEKAVEKFMENRKKGKKAKGSTEFLFRNAVLAFVCNAPRDAFYSLLNFRHKSERAKAAYERSGRLNSPSTVTESENPTDDTEEYAAVL